jgi:hypothetical protein
VENQSKEIKILKAVFDGQISTREVPKFRGAVVEKVGRENILFHNHLNQHAFRYSYPLVQYKQFAGNPIILCIDQGVDEIYKFIENIHWKLTIGRRSLDMKIRDLQVEILTLQVDNQEHQYKLFNWIALNEKNFKIFHQMETRAERNHFLEKILKGNMLAFAKGIGWRIEKTIKASIIDIESAKPLKFKGHPLLCFTLRFKTNVILPGFIGLGKGVSRGFGIVKTG